MATIGLTVEQAIKKVMDHDDPMALWFRPEEWKYEAFALQVDKRFLPDGTVDTRYTIVRVPSPDGGTVGMTTDPDDFLQPWEVVTPQEVFEEIGD